MAANEDSQTPIRRGRGLRLSTQSSPSDETSAPVDAPAQPDETTPITHGRGLRLSTQSSPSDETSTPADAPAQPDETTSIARGRELQPTTRARGTITSMQRAQLRTPSGFITYRRRGAGPPLLLIHGFGASGRIWRGVMDALGDQHTCYAPDLPGSGASAPRGISPTLAVLAAEVLAIADVLELERFDLAGHALGAAVAATLAGHSPERVARLALTSLAVRSFAPELTTLDATRLPFDLTLAMTRPLLNLWRPWLGWAMATPPATMLLGVQLHTQPSADNQLWQEYLADYARADPRTYITSITAQADSTLKANLRAIKSPTLLIVGRQDSIAPPAEVIKTQALIAGAQVRVIEGCGHMPAIERPAEYHAILREFFIEQD